MTAPKNTRQAGLQEAAAAARAAAGEFEEIDNLIEADTLRDFASHLDHLATLAGPA